MADQDYCEFLRLARREISPVEFWRAYFAGQFEALTRDMGDGYSGEFTVDLPEHFLPYKQPMHVTWDSLSYYDYSSDARFMSGVYTSIDKCLMEVLFSPPMTVESRPHWAQLRCLARLLNGESSLPSAYENARQWLIDSLRCSPPTLVDVLETCLRQPSKREYDTYARNGDILNLGVERNPLILALAFHTSSPAIQEALVEIVQHPYSYRDTRSYAIWSLGRHANNSASEALVSWFVGHRWSDNLPMIEQAMVRMCSCASLVTLPITNRRTYWESRIEDAAQTPDGLRWSESVFWDLRLRAAVERPGGVLLAQLVDDEVLPVRTAARLAFSSGEGSF